MAWSLFLYAIGWLLSLDLSTFFWDASWAHSWANPSWFNLAFKNMEMEYSKCEYLELDFVPPIFGPLKIRSNGLSLQGWARLWLFLVLGDLRLSDMYVRFLRKCKLSLCITLISQTELIARYLTRLGFFVFLNVFYKKEKKKKKKSFDVGKCFLFIT